LTSQLEIWIKGEDVVYSQKVVVDVDEGRIVCMQAWSELMLRFRFTSPSTSEVTFTHRADDSQSIHKDSHQPHSAVRCRYQMPSSRAAPRAEFIQFDFFVVSWNTVLCGYAKLEPSFGSRCQSVTGKYVSRVQRVLVGEDVVPN
jgi:hypothetical protein